jgi:hypothetical protein
MTPISREISGMLASESWRPFKIPQKAKIVTKNLLIRRSFRECGLVNVSPKAMGPLRRAVMNRMATTVASDFISAHPVLSTCRFLLLADSFYLSVFTECWLHFLLIHLGEEHHIDLIAVGARHPLLQDSFYLPIPSTCQFSRSVGFTSYSFTLAKSAMSI